MSQVSAKGLSFKSESSAEKKTFTVEIPMDVVLTLRYDEKELKKMQKFDKSERVSDKLRMLALMATKVEKNYKEIENEQE